MTTLRLNDNPQFFNDAVELYHRYLFDSWVPDFKCRLTSEEVKNQVQISLCGERDYFLEVESGKNCVWITFWEPSWEYERLYETWGLYVLPEYRRRGIALGLKRKKIDFIRWKEAFDWMYSKIHKSNKWSVKLHEKLGFQIIPDENSEWNMVWLELT